MNHLSVDDIIDFVSINELNSESIKLAATVNGHIRKCDRCLKLVRSFQMIYDEFSMLNMRGDFRKYISENFSSKESDNEKDIIAENEFEEFDGYR